MLGAQQGIGANWDLPELWFSAAELYARPRILAMGVRNVRPPLFRTIATALGSRKRIDWRCRSRSLDDSTRRTILSRRLVRYRANWYPDQQTLRDLVAK